MSFRIISSSEAVQMDGMSFAPFTRYVLPAGPAQALGRALKSKDAVHSMSIWNSYHRPYAGQSLNGKRLAIYRHAAFGDQLMITGIASYLAHSWPRAKIDVYCAPQVLDLWRGLPVRAIPAPMSFDAARAYDYHLFYDQMLEENREPDQNCAWDDFFAFAGICTVSDNFKCAIPDSFKRPAAVVLAEDFAEVATFDFNKPYAVVQLQATNGNRTYPPDQLARFCQLFAAEYPDWRILLVGQDQPKGVLFQFETAWATTVQKAGRTLEHNLFAQMINAVGAFKSFRTLYPLVANARLVVCPDSSIGHLAAAFPKVPVISLWGVFAPQDRALYYDNHHALFRPTACPFAPCRNHEFTLPQEKCRQAPNATPGEQPWCNALRAISAEDILAKAKEILCEPSTPNP